MSSRLPARIDDVIFDPEGAVMAEEQIEAREVRVGDNIRLPDAGSAHRISSIRLVEQDEGGIPSRLRGHIELGVGWGSCSLEPSTLVTRVLD